MLDIFLSSTNALVRCPVLMWLQARTHSRLHCLRHQRRMAAAAPAAPAADTLPADSEDTILQYIVLRRDLWRDEGWPLGPLVAQGCHAAVAAIQIAKDDPLTQQYLAEDALDHMHKVRKHGRSRVIAFKISPCYAHEWNSTIQL